MSERTLISQTVLRRHRVAYFSVLTFFVVLFALVFLFPLYWMVTNAVKDCDEIFRTIPTLVPESFHPEAFRIAWTRLQIGHFFLNTIFYTAILWLLFAGPAKVRRIIRGRRGQCPACAYPIGTSNVCTECGRTLPSSSR